MTNSTSCESFKNSCLEDLGQHLTFEAKSHLESCVSCREFFNESVLILKAHQQIDLKDPPEHLTKAIFEQIRLSSAPKNSPQKTKWRWLDLFSWQPMVVAFAAFILVFGLTLFIRQPNPPEQVSRHTESLAPNTQFVPAPLLSSKPKTASFQPPSAALSTADFVMRPSFSFGADLDPNRLGDGIHVSLTDLKQVDLQLLGKISNESAAYFKHELALRYMIDGEDEKAADLLTTLVEENFDYSKWESASLQRLRLMKKMGKIEEAKKDLARLKEYGLRNSRFIEEAEAILK